MSDFIDQPKDVRKGEELDLPRLTEYLARNLPGVSSSARVEVRQFPSGHSNLTYALDVDGAEYVLRRPPFGSKVKSAHDMGREFRVLSRLHSAYPPAPEPVLYCEDEAVLGAKFYVMRRLKGMILRKTYPEAFDSRPDDVRRLNLAVADNLARIHAIDFEKAGLGDLGKPEGYVKRQVEGWLKRYEASQTDDIPSVGQVARWLESHMPAEGSPALIHNDYKLDNLVLDPGDPTRIVGVLDWEMATIGDPLMDLGTAISYWVEPGDDDTIKMMKWGPTDQPGSIGREEFVDRYRTASGRAVPDPLFYFVFGCFKSAAVIQQIYYRYKQGLTKDERFAMIIAGVHIVCAHAAARLDAGHI